MTNHHRSRHSPPSHLSPAAAALWKRLYETYEFNAEASVLPLDSLCESWDRARQCREALNGSPLTITDKHGGVRVHPLIVEERQARDRRRGWRGSCAFTSRETMPCRSAGMRPVRPQAQRTHHPLTMAQLEGRARWGGLLAGVPALNDDERAQWAAHRSATWVPQTALMDPWHGRGPWSIAAFRKKLAADRVAINGHVATFPAQASRLRRWTEAIEAFARQRTEAPEEELKNVGEFYKALDRLGYDPNL